MPKGKIEISDEVGQLIQDLKDKNLKYQDLCYRAITIMCLPVNLRALSGDPNFQSVLEMFAGFKKELDDLGVDKSILESYKRVAVCGRCLCN